MVEKLVKDVKGNGIWAVAELTWLDEEIHVNVDISLHKYKGFYNILLMCFKNHMSFHHIWSLIMLST
jgi:D-alanyl-D-alanine carboxypeptidase